MGRSLNEAREHLWLMSHACKIAAERRAYDHVKRNVKFAMLGGSHGFVATFASPVMQHLEKFGPEKLGKVVACGAAPDNTSRTPMSAIGLSEIVTYEGSQDGYYKLFIMAVDVMLAALYDVTVVAEGRRRSQKGMYWYLDNGRKCWHGPTVTIVDNGRQMTVENPFWRAEAVGLIYRHV